MPCNFGFTSSTCRRRCLEWFLDRSRLELGLLLTVTVFCIIILCLASSGHPSAGGKVSATCQTSTCLKQAGKIMEVLDLNTDPCEDFYKFSCHNFLQNADRQDKLDLEKYREQQLIDIYMEPPTTYDHIMVRSAKELYQACLDEVEIEREEVKTIKEVVKAAGGWPILEGLDWNEAEFDWLKATFKFRELGYYHKVFLDLTVVHHPQVVRSFIFKVSTGSSENKYESLHKDMVNNVMRDVADIFGAENKERVSAEMKDAYEFWLKLQQYDYSSKSKYPFDVYTMYRYQQQFEAMNWSKFVNTFTDQIITVQDNEDVLFPPVQNMSSWLDLIASTPKRTLANYMMYRVIDETVPFLHRELRGGPRAAPTQEQFCLRIAEKSYTPSPIRLLLDSRNLPTERRKIAMALLESIASELIEALRNIEWIDEKDKDRSIKVIRTMDLMIERPEGFIVEDVLDDMDVDMVEVKRKIFLNFIAQAARNDLSARYNQVNKQISESYLERWQIRDEDAQYNNETNTLFVPGYIFDMFFDEKRPQYLNYGAIGALLGHFFGGIIDSLGSQKWSENTKEKLKQIQNCLKERLGDYIKMESVPYPLRETLENEQLTNLIKQTLGQKISRQAYYKWLEENGREFPLLGTGFTPNQLFWIAAANTFCPRGLKSSLHRRHKSLSNTVVISIRNHSDFGQDFKCPNNEMNVFTQCHVF